MTFHTGYAKNLEEALDEAAEYFVKSAVRIEYNQALHILEIVNFHSNKRDDRGRKIEDALFLAMERRNADFKLMKGPGENREDEINLSGTYEMKADTVTLRLQIFKDKEILAQYNVDYEADQTRKKSLVAVLDIEAENLEKSQRKAFGDVFRSHLADTGVFDLASSAEIDKLDPDVIQKSTGCTRDTCATIIGEQLGVDRVISSSLFMVTEHHYILSSKIMDIEDGSILVSRVVEHRSRIEKLPRALKEMAKQLTSDPAVLEQADTEEQLIQRTITEALEEAAAYFVTKAVRIESNQELHVEKVVHFESGKNDDIGKRIEIELYFALEGESPDFKLFLGEVKNKEKEIILSGKYEKRGSKIFVHFQITKGDEILAQYKTDYDGKAHRRSLVAVLDLEAETLNLVQRKAFSEILRATLSKIGIFEMTSSADIDKLDPDAIQKETGCTRDTCATKIGEQLGVDRVVSSSLSKVSEENFVLAAKLIDIQNGSVLVAKALEHDGDVTKLKGAVENLAYYLAGKKPPATPELEQDQVGQIVVNSTPTGASIILDGNPIPETTETLLKNIPIGIHTINVYKGNIGATETFQLNPHETKRLDLTLTESAPLMINSEPYGARVFLDGRDVGTTPLTVDSDLGWRKIRAEHPFSDRGDPDYITFTNVKLLSANQVNINFNQPYAEVTIILNPSDAQLLIDSEDVGDRLETDFDSLDDTREITLSLPTGKHTISATHPAAVRSVTRTININDDKKEYETSVSLEMQKPYIRKLKYESEMSTWPWKWGGALTGAVIAGLYTVQQSQAAAKAREDQDAEIDAALSSASTELAQSHSDAAKEHNESVKQHNQNAMISGLLSAGLFGLATWIWLDEPQKPTEMTWRPVVTPGNKIGLSYHRTW